MSIDLSRRTAQRSTQPRPQTADSQTRSANCAPSAMSDLNSPEKPRSEPSLGGSQPHSWSDVTLIEDITQESLSRRLSAQCLGEYIQSSSESEAEQPSPTDPQEQPIQSQIPTQAVCVVKRFPTLPWSVNSIKRPRMPWDPQPGARPIQVSLRPRMPQPPNKGGLQPRFFAPPPRWSQHLLGVAVPKPRPLTRPPPRSLIYRPPAGHKPDRVRPLGLFTVKDLPSQRPASTEGKSRTATKPPAPQARPSGLVSRASQETSRKEACLSAWHKILQILGSASSLQSSLANSKYPEALLRKSLEKFTAGTLERYIAATRQFLDFLGLSNRTMASLDVTFLADFLHACENSLEEDREVCKIGPRPILKALSWLSRIAEVPALQPIMQASLIRAFSPSRPLIAKKPCHCLWLSSSNGKSTYAAPIAHKTYASFWEASC